MTSRILLLALALPAFAAPPEPKFKHVTLDAAVQIGYGVAVADVDGDKAPDVLLADKKQFVWYRNPGAAKAADAAAWTKHILAENLTEKDNVCLAAQDIDGDGKCEIAVGGEWNPGDTEKSGAVFYLIPPADRTQRWEPVKFPAVEPTTHRMKWVNLGGKDWGLVVVPLHGRGNKNGEGAPVKVLCYRKPADVRGEWKAEVVNESLHMTHNFDVVPDHAGNTRLLLAGREGFGFVTRAADGKWQFEKDIPATSPQSKFAGAGEIRFGYLQNKIKIIATVEPMHGNALVIYPRLPMGGGPVPQVEAWPRTPLNQQFADGHALACGDVLGIGGDQIVIGWRGNPKQPRPVGIKLFTPIDNAGARWQERLIDDNEMACEDLVLADLNADGKLDIAASGRSTHNLKIYLNETGR